MIQRAFARRAAGRGGFTIIELMLVVGLIGILSTLAIPIMIRFQLKAKVAEGRTNMAAIREAEETYFAEWGAYASALPAIPLSVGPGKEPWVLLPTDSHGFNTIGYSPEGEMYFQYGVTSDGATAYTVGARSDVDGDGAYNTWGYVKPAAGTGTGVVGPFGVCPGTGVIDPDTRVPNRFVLVGPCDAASGISAY